EVLFAGRDAAGPVFCASAGDRRAAEGQGFVQLEPGRARRGGRGSARLRLDAPQCRESNSDTRSDRVAAAQARLRGTAVAGQFRARADAGPRHGARHARVAPGRNPGPAFRNAVASGRYPISIGTPAEMAALYRALEPLVRATPSKRRIHT